MSPVLTRPATATDFEATAALLTELGGKRAPLPPPGSARERVRAVYERHLARASEGRGLVLVAEQEGRVVGLLVADVRERLTHETPELWIADLVVAAAARGQGIGKALLDAAVARALALGAHRVSLESGHWRKDAHRFYAREGFADEALHFGRDLRA